MASNVKRSDKGTRVDGKQILVEMTGEKWR